MMRALATGTDQVREIAVQVIAAIGAEAKAAIPALEALAASGGETLGRLAREALAAIKGE